MRPILKPRRVIVLCFSLALIGTFYSVSRSARASSTLKSAEESIGTYDSDCVTPKTVFYLGDTVCAKAADFPFFPESGYRRLQWAAPNGHVADRVGIATDPDAHKFVIPTSGDLAQVGNWYASTVNPEANREVRARFIVRDRRQFFADLVITKWKLSDLIPGERIVYRLRVTNPGPDFAEGIEITDEVPEFMVFAGVRQSSGEQIDCATPKAG